MTRAHTLPPLSAGRQIDDKFEILGVLGEGGMGIVYDARRIEQGDRVALKVIHSRLAGDAQIRGRFAREVAILRRLEGNHLCPVLEFGETSDDRALVRSPSGQEDPPRREQASLLYMALPRIDGPALDALLKKEGPLSVPRAVAIVLDVCEALREAHAQGVIHRDLKPGNVLLRGGESAVVVDFGMAKIVTGGGTGTTGLTQHNMVFGTPEYMAPEQARGDELDARCDVYAAGIILYELLTGRVPFSGATPLNVLTAHLTEPPLAPRQRAPDRSISLALEAVTMHAIQKDPAHRYATASALATALRSALAAPGDLDAVRPASRVNVTVDTLDAHAETLPSPRPSERASPAVAPPPAPQRASRTWTIAFVVAAIVGIALGAWLSMRP